MVAKPALQQSKLRITSCQQLYHRLTCHFGLILRLSQFIPITKLYKKVVKSDQKNYSLATSTKVEAEAKLQHMLFAENE